MQWNKDKIRELRLRMGWSQSDMARRLQCETKDIECLEEGHQEPCKVTLSELNSILMVAEECSVEIHEQPMAEQVLDNSSLGQINYSELNDIIQ